MRETADDISNHEDHTTDNFNNAPETIARPINEYSSSASITTDAAAESDDGLFQRARLPITSRYRPRQVVQGQEVVSPNLCERGNERRERNNHAPFLSLKGLWNYMGENANCCCRESKSSRVMNCVSSPCSCDATGRTADTGASTNRPQASANEDEDVCFLCLHAEYTPDDEDDEPTSANHGYQSQGAVMGNLKRLFAFFKRKNNDASGVLIRSKHGCNAIAHAECWKKCMDKKMMRCPFCRATDEDGLYIGQRELGILTRIDDHNRPMYGLGANNEPTENYLLEEEDADEQRRRLAYILGNTLPLNEVYLRNNGQQRSAIWTHDSRSPSLSPDAAPRRRGIVLTGEDEEDDYSAAGSPTGFYEAGTLDGFEE